MAKKGSTVRYRYRERTKRRRTHREDYHLAPTLFLASAAAVPFVEPGYYGYSAAESVAAMVSGEGFSYGLGTFADNLGQSLERNWKQMAGLALVGVAAKEIGKHVNTRLTKRVKLL